MFFYRNNLKKFIDDSIIERGGTSGNWVIYLYNLLSIYIYIILYDLILYNNL